MRKLNVIRGHESLTRAKPFPGEKHIAVSGIVSCQGRDRSSVSCTGVSKFNENVIPSGPRRHIRLHLEAVPHAGLGEQMAGMRRVVFEFAPQLRQIDTKVVGLGGICRSPHFLEELLAADQLTAITD